MSINKVHYKPEQLIVHRGVMCLLDSIDNWGPDWIECSVLHRQGCSFARKDGAVPSWVSLEYMCQAIAALEGIQRLAKNMELCLGFVLGTKALHASVDCFKQNQAVFIRVDEEMKNSTSLGLYACKVYDANGRLLVHACIKAVMPEDPYQILSI